VWTVQRTWFWSLVYPDRHGGAIGAAASEAEAVEEAQAAIERVAQLCDDSGIALAPGDGPGCRRRLQSSKDLQFFLGSKMAGANGDLAYPRASRKQRSKMRTIGERYNNLWQLTLQQYAARVAAA